MVVFGPEGNSASYRSSTPPLGIDGSFTSDIRTLNTCLTLDKRLFDAKTYCRSPSRHSDCFGPTTKSRLLYGSARPPFCKAHHQFRRSRDLSLLLRRRCRFTRDHSYFLPLAPRHTRQRGPGRDIGDCLQRSADFARVLGEA